MVKFSADMPQIRFVYTSNGPADGSIYYSTESGWGTATVNAFLGLDFVSTQIELETLQIVEACLPQIYARVL